MSIKIYGDGKVLGDLAGTINTVTTGITQPASDDSNLIATTEYVDSVSAIGIPDHNDLQGVQGGDPSTGDAYHLTLEELENLGSSGDTEVHKVDDISGTLTDYDVSSARALRALTGSGNVFIRGFSAGVEGQRLTIFKENSSSSTLSVFDSDGAGTQKIRTTNGNNISSSGTDLASVDFIFDGTFWLITGTYGF